MPPVTARTISEGISDLGFQLSDLEGRVPIGLLPNLKSEILNLKFQGLVAEIELDAFAGADDADVTGEVEHDLVLEDFLEHDLEVVLEGGFHQGTAAALQLQEALLDQGRQLEASAHLVHDLFFFELFEHETPSITVSCLARA